MKNNLSKKISYLLLCGMFFSVSLTLFFALTDMHKLAKTVALTSLTMKLESDMASASKYCRVMYGNLLYKNGDLTDSNGISISGRFDLVDTIKNSFDDAATIFVKKDNDFERISTNITKDDGSRAVGTMLGKTSNAYNMVTSGKEYIGSALILGKQFLTCYKPIMDNSDNVIGILFIGIPFESVNNVINHNFTNSEIKCIGSAVLSLVILLVLCWILLKRMFRPITHAIELLDDISKGEGDLTKRLSESGQDEISEMSRLFNIFTLKLQNIIREVKDVSKQLMITSEILDSKSNALARHVNTIKEGSEAARSSSAQAVDKVNLISLSAGQTSTSVVNMANAIEQITLSFNDVSNNCQKENSIVSSASAQIESAERKTELLTNSASEISTIVSIIKSIANQTDLLALNAAIEAANAGAAGKGFAIVAGEVKALARKTANATETIRVQIESMLSNTKDVTQSIKSFVNTFNEINSISQIIASAVEEQSITMHNVSQNITEIGTTTSGIAQNVASTADDFSNVSAAINGVHDSVAIANTELETVYKNISDARKIAVQLDKIVNMFKV